ncbi:unnamed protein product, partial [Schistosoma mattheei]
IIPLSIASVLAYLIKRLSTLFLLKTKSNFVSLLNSLSVCLELIKKVEHKLSRNSSRIVCPTAPFTNESNVIWLMTSNNE